MRKTPRSRKYLAWIRTQACCVSGREIGVEACHVRMGHRGGMGLKPSDYATVPLHADLHREQHQHGEKAFWAKYGKDPDVEIISMLCRFIGDTKQIILALEDGIINGVQCEAPDAEQLDD